MATSDGSSWHAVYAILVGFLALIFIAVVGAIANLLNKKICFSSPELLRVRVEDVELALPSKLAINIRMRSSPEKRSYKTIDLSLLRAEAVRRTICQSRNDPAFDAKSMKVSFRYGAGFLPKSIARYPFSYRRLGLSFWIGQVNVLPPDVEMKTSHAYPHKSGMMLCDAFVMQEEQHG